MWLRSRKPLYYLGALDLGKSSKSSWPLQVRSFSDTPYKISKAAPLQERKMIDRFRLWARGGDGGNGCSSIRRSRHNRHGKPDGGKGGRGGDVILECTPAVWDFSGLQHHIKAGRGGHGAPKNKIGSRGADKVVQVPVGTVIHLVKGDVPSVVEKSSTTLDPWDIPGRLADELSDSTSQSFDSNTSCIKAVETSVISNGFAFCAQTNVAESAGAKQASCASLVESLPQSSPSGGKSRVCNDDIFSTGGNLSEWEDINTDGCVPEEEWENIDTDGGVAEEELEEDHIQHNVAELTEPGQQLVVALGGNGGLGNVSLAKAKKHNLGKPRMQRDDACDPQVADDDQHSSVGAGLPASEVVLVLELKSIADVGLVGMPNAGKSTLLGAISRAQPNIGHYAFTTLRPNLGNLNYDDLSITVADIPGLIRGAHENRGLGHAFLRHIERTKVIAYVLDLSAAIDGRKGLQPWEQLRDLILELEFYSEGLSNRPALIVANKIDEAGAEEVCEELKRRVPGVPIFPVCAVLEEGIPELKLGLRTLANGVETCRIKLDDIVVD